MNTIFNQQISEEHQHLLDLCTKIESMLKNPDEENNFYRLQDIVEDLQYQLINIHHPKDRSMIDRISQSNINKPWIGLLQNFQYPSALTALNHLHDIITAANLGTVINRKHFLDSGTQAIQQLRSMIDFEEQICLPLVTKKHHHNGQYPGRAQ